MDALELSLRCTSLLMKSMMKKDSTGSIEGVQESAEMSDSSLPPPQDQADSMDESDCEKHFANHGKNLSSIVLALRL